MSTSGEAATTYRPQTAYRSHMCGSLRPADAGSQVRLGGWVHRRRNLGGMVFVDLRDWTGIVQVSLNPDQVDAGTLEAAVSVSVESVVQVDVEVVLRTADMRDHDRET